MPIRVWYNPANPKQQYTTGIANDPNVPAGYLDSQGSDGAQPEAVKVYTAGVNNQGAGAVGYLATADGDPQQRIDQPYWPNGILNGYGGAKPGLGLGATYGEFKYGERPYGGW
jgi:hypothetical protein